MRMMRERTRSSEHTGLGLRIGAIAATLSGSRGGRRMAEPAVRARRTGGAKPQ